MRRLTVFLLILALALAAAQALAETPPVEFTLQGVDAAKKATVYQLKINASQPIDQVDLHLIFFDQGGKMVMDTDVIWQNVVQSKRQPIEAGKIYTVEDVLPQGAVKATGRLKRVVFKDGTSWNAPK